MGQPLALHSSCGTWTSTGTATAALAPGHFWTHVDLQVLMSSALMRDRKCFEGRAGGPVKRAGATDNKPLAHRGDFCKAAESLPSLQDQLSNSPYHSALATASSGLFPLPRGHPCPCHHRQQGGCPQQRAPIATFSPFSFRIHFKGHSFQFCNWHK